jgi:hypothetical protein
MSLVGTDVKHVPYFSTAAVKNANLFAVIVADLAFKNNKHFLSKNLPGDDNI